MISRLDAVSRTWMINSLTGLAPKLKKLPDSFAQLNTPATIGKESSFSDVSKSQKRDSIPQESSGKLQNFFPIAGVNALKSCFQTFSDDLNTSQRFSEMKHLC